MSWISAVSWVVLAAGAEVPWEQAGQSDGITVYSRERKDSGVHEVKATGMFDGAPKDVWAAIRDYPHYTQTMPYTEEAKVVSTEQDGKVIYFYSVINAPLVDRRDYVIKLVDESDWQDGKGYLKVTWTASDKDAPPARNNVVRVKTNDGYWLLEPREGGAKTFGTYYLYTDPGGSLPKWVVNKANSSTVPDIFKCIRKVIAKGKK
jgi:START domain